LKAAGIVNISIQNVVELYERRVNRVENLSD